MTNERAAAIYRVSPCFKRAATLHEEIQSKLVPFREMQGELLEKAREAGQSLEQGAIALKNSGLDIAFDDVLSAHAPNIKPKQADKYRRYSRGECDPKQLIMPFEPKLLTDAKPSRAVPADWELAWAFSVKFIKHTSTFDTWPKEQIDLTRQRLEPVARKLWPEKF